MNSTHPDIHALAGAYALDALPPDEERSFEEHLAVCSTCRQEVDEFLATAAVLAHATEEPAPEGMRDRVLAAVDVTRQDPAPRPRAPEPRGAGLRGALMSAAAAAVIVIVGLTAVVANLNSRIDRLEARNAEVFSVLAAEGSRTVTVTGEGGTQLRLTVAPNEDRALLVARNMPRIGDDQVLELWLIDDGGPRPAGLFRPDQQGAAVELLDLDLAGAQLVAVTVEPEGGSLQPTTEPFIAGEVPTTEA